jgi:acyl-CoA synthetase (AMP-forming)/AMP-acid ligase II/aryl carrier-like protein
VRSLVVAGDVVTEALVTRWAPGRRMFNAYGPTEATIWATVQACASGDVGHPCIGRPIANARVYVLDAHGQPAPVGVTGEIHIGGAGVARGYLSRPALTAARFVPDPFGGAPGARLYRTGDLGRWRTDGTLEFLGRNDFQVKVRGFRIELGEIEARLAEYPGVRETVVLAREDTPGDQRLVAYIAGAGEALDAERLRAHLSARLPEALVPAAYVRLEAFPLTPNGKVNRRALPAPERDAYATRAYEAPRGPVEEALAAIWTELLGVDGVGRWANFFELGGHSLRAVTLIERLRQRGLHAEVRAVFTAPTLAALAATVSEAPRDVPVPPNLIVPSDHPDTHSLSLTL